MKFQSICQKFVTCSGRATSLKDFARKPRQSERNQKTGSRPVKSYPQAGNFYHLVTVMTLFLSGILTAAYGQTSDQDTNRKSYFGAPVIKYTAIRDQAAWMIGGRGGWNIIPSLVIGGGVYATISEVDAKEGAVPMGVPDIFDPLDVKFDCFGFEMEYIFHPEASTNITLYTLIGGAAVRYATDKTNNQQGETDLTFLLEPAVGLEWELSDWLHLNLSLSYRLVSGVDQPGLNESDFNNAAVSLAVKLGQF